MNFVKKNFKLIIGFIIGVILASSITVYAYSYFASDIQYTNNKSVANALDELYSSTGELNTIKSNLNQTNATASDISSGKKAYTKNGLITGTKKDVFFKTITHNPNENIDDINIGFSPTYVYVTFRQNSDRFIYSVYDKNISSAVYSVNYINNSYSDCPSIFYIDGSYLKTTSLNGYALTNSYTITIIAY